MGFRKVLLFCCLFSACSLCAQAPAVSANLPVSCDCISAKLITIDKPLTYGPTAAPEGSGLEQEIKPSRKNPSYSFEKEHHSAWYKLNIQVNGNLCFDIIPENPGDDYDFMLFRDHKDSLSCDSISRELVIPLRANISRQKKEIKGVTGLNSTAEKELVREGAGEAYCKSIEVKKGQAYYLVLDNVYEKGMGHILSFYFERVVELSGKVTDDEGRPLEAEITVSGPKGEEVVKTSSDKITGNYTIKTPLRENKNYTMIMYSDSMFIGVQSISTKSKPAALQNIKTVLPFLRKGNKYKITTINFFGGEDIYLPAAVPSIEALFKLMKRNGTLKIQVEGHTNGCGPASKGRDEQQLSEDRARKIKDYLVERGIERLRIQTIGYGCKKMLYSQNGTLWEQEQNRRVEINVLEL